MQIWINPLYFAFRKPNIVETSVKKLRKMGAPKNLADLQRENTFSVSILVPLYLNPLKNSGYS